MTEASTTRTPSTPRSLNLLSTTASLSSGGPILHVPQGWQILVPIYPAIFKISSSVWYVPAGTCSSGQYCFIALCCIIFLVIFIASIAFFLSCQSFKQLNIIFGGVEGSQLVIRTVPWLFGLRSQTLKVIESNRKKEKGCYTVLMARGMKWYCRSGHYAEREECRKAPSWAGAIVSGPDFLIKYEQAIFDNYKGFHNIEFRVWMFFTLYTGLNCKWSCKFSPTPSSSTLTLHILFYCSHFPPMPDLCSMTGDPIAPADRISSLSHAISTISLFAFLTRHPFTLLFQTISLSTSIPVQTFRLSLLLTSSPKNPSAVLHLSPFS